MGKSLPDTTRLQQLARSTSQHLKTPKRPKPSSPATAKSGGVGGESKRVKLEKMENNVRVPLSEVISDCVKRWFQDTLRDAKSGDINMQVLVSQMYYSGYGVPRDTQKGRIWMTRASRTRSSVWKVSDKHPGYNASDSDSDELKGDS
ncbi:hypothetical protein L1049_008783 [Liquidambar formosana]|uniref:Uncharacterized protein n=1 Tax=Liquidambar formosana TaxID=63359 RepID=A0AAP0S9Y6_LIQFO